MKRSIRDKWLKVRQNIPALRREEAAEKLQESVLALLQNPTHVLSYASLPNELSTEKLNQHLIQKNCLALPKVVGFEILIFKITDLANQLTIGSFGIYEPDPKKCEQLKPNEISHIIVPGLCFDSCKHRLGYGKGHYDRLLGTSCAHSFKIGVGFTEQFSKELLPAEPHDVQLDQIIFV